MKIKHIFSVLAATLLFATNAWGQWTAPEAPVREHVEVTTEDPVSGETYYVMNVEGQQFLSGGKSWYSWDTSTILVGLDDALQFTLSKNADGKWSFARTTDNKYTFISGARDGKGEMHVDMGTQGHNYFELIKQQNGYYHIRIAQNDLIYGETAVEDWAERCWGWEGASSEYPTAVYGTVKPEDGYACDWAFIFEPSDELLIAEEEYKFQATLYQARLILYNLAKEIDDENLDVDYMTYIEIYNGEDIDDIEYAITELKAAILEAKWQKAIDGASEANPADVTFLLTNPDFEQLNTNGWELTISGQNVQYQRASYTNGDVTIEHFIEAWSFSGNGTLGDGWLAQTIYDMPAGKYTLEADIIAVNQGNAATPVTGAYLFAKMSDIYVQTSVATGNEAPEHFELTFISGGGDVTLGVRVENTTANWLAADNFRLTYYGQTVDSQELISLRYAIEQAENVNVDAPAESSIRDAFLQALQEAQSLVNTGGSTDEYASAKQTLQDAQSNFETSVNDYTRLYTIITGWRSRLSALEGSKWATAAYSVSSLLDDMLSAYNNGSYTQQDINNADAWLEAVLSEAISGLISNGDDLTFLLNNPGFASDFSGWTLAEGSSSPFFGGANIIMPDDYEPVPELAGTVVDGGCAEVYHATFDISQTIKSMPTGTYTLSCQAFERDDNGAGIEAELYAIINNGSYTQVQKIKNLYDEVSPVQLYNNTIQGDVNSNPQNFNDSPHDDGYVPNGMNGANVYFRAGYYKNTFDIKLTETSDITIGIRTTSDGDWVLFDDFKLIYKGQGEEEDELTINVDANHGDWTSGNSANTYFCTWASTASEIGVTLTEFGGRNNMQYYDGQNIQLLTGAGETTQTTYTIAPKSAEYRISAINLDFKSDNEYCVQVSVNDNIYENCDNSEFTNIALSDLNLNTLSLTISTTGPSNHFVQTQNFIVTLKKIEGGDPELIANYRYLETEAKSLIQYAKSHNTGEHFLTGLVTDASQFSSPYTETTEGSTANLLDGNANTFWHSTWSDGEGKTVIATPGVHYLQVEMPSTEDLSILMEMTRRPVPSNHITEWSVYGTNDYDAEKGDCQLLTILLTPYNVNTETLWSTTFQTWGYQYLRFYLEKTTTGSGFGHLSEFQLYEATPYQNLFYATGATGTALEQLVNVADEDITSDMIQTLSDAIQDFKLAINGVLTEEHRQQEDTSEALAALQQALADAWAIVNARELVGDGLYLKPTQAYNDFASVVYAQQQVADNENATKSELENALAILQEAQTRYEQTPVNEPVLGQQYMFQLKSTGNYLNYNEEGKTLVLSKMPQGFTWEQLINAWRSLGSMVLLLGDPKAKPILDGDEYFYTISAGIFYLGASSGEVGTGVVPVQTITDNSKWRILEYEYQPQDIADENGNHYQTTQENTLLYCSTGTSSEDITIPSDVQGITVSGIAQNAFAQAQNAKAITIPQTVTYVAPGAFDGCTALAIIWKSNEPLPVDAFQNYGVSTANLLLFYDTAPSQVPDGVQNVVVGGKAEEIVLQDQSPFYSPQRFTAGTVSYTHKYGMTTGYGYKDEEQTVKVAAGWETITLPFDVETITHVATESRLVPFGEWTAGDDTKPFWLYELRGNSFRQATEIRANTPYIISMPNNEVYQEQYNLTGEITFSGYSSVENTKKDNLRPVTQGDRSFQPNYDILPTNVTFYTINSVTEFYDSRQNEDDVPGSRFVAGARQVYPFEAFFMNTSNGVKGDSFGIQFEGTTDIPSVPFSTALLPSESAKVYNLAGQLVRTSSSVAHPEALLRGLPAGVYIVNGRKVTIR